MSWFCRRWQAHSWGDWQDLEQGDIVVKDLITGDRRVRGKYLIQERICAACKEKQLQSRRTYLA